MLPEMYAYFIKSTIKRVCNKILTYSQPTLITTTKPLSRHLSSKTIKDLLSTYIPPLPTSPPPFQQVAALINADPREIIFTSGATESNNIAIKGIGRFYGEKKKHLITCQTVSVLLYVWGTILGKKRC